MTVGWWMAVGKWQQGAYQLSNTISEKYTRYGAWLANICMYVHVVFNMKPCLLTTSGIYRYAELHYYY